MSIIKKTKKLKIRMKLKEKFKNHFNNHLKLKTRKWTLVKNRCFYKIFLTA